MWRCLPRPPAIVVFIRAHELYDYDPETGHFHARYDRSTGGGYGRWDPARICGSVKRSSQGYRIIGLDCRTYQAHRLAWLMMTGSWPDGDLDHINGDRDDNRWSNLRPATVAQNGHNRKRHRNNTSGFKGVSKHGNRWRMTVKFNGARFMKGGFATAEEAFLARNQLAEKLHGAYARAE